MNSTYDELGTAWAHAYDMKMASTDVVGKAAWHHVMLAIEAERTKIRNLLTVGG